MKEITAELLNKEEAGLRGQIAALETHLADTQSALEQAKGSLRTVLALKQYQQEDAESKNGEGK